jgi:hypothetical protein
VRPNHWVGNVRPLPGPDGLLWLLTERQWLLALDPVFGDRRIDQPAAGGDYAVFTGGWPHVVRRRDARPLPTVAVARGRIVTSVDGRETGSVAIPKDLGKDPHARLGDRFAWLAHRPSRGKVPMRIACFDLEAQAFGPVHALDFETAQMSVAGSRLALFDEPTGRVHLYDRERLVRVVPHVPSASWGHVALDGDELAVVSHQQGSRPGAVVAVGWAQLGEGAEPAMRRFALHTQGATYVTFLEGFLAIHQYADVTLVARDALRAAPAGTLVLEIEDLATRPPAAAQTAKVTFVGATTGFGFVESEGLGRLRFQFEAEHPPALGDVVALDDVDAGVVRRWHAVGSGPRPLDPASRALEPAAWSDLDSLLARNPAAGPSVPSIPTDAAWCTAVRVGAYLSDPDRDDEPVDDVEAFRALDGTIERSGDLLDYLLDDERDAAPEIVALRPTLRFGGDPSRLHLALEFYTRRPPSEVEVAAFSRTAGRLLESGWGTNYEFDAPAGYAGCRVALDFQELGTATRPVGRDEP